MSSRLKSVAFFLLFLKVLLAIVFPVFGDEAYYFYWGSHFSQGYYDLPPMVGWWLWPVLKLTSNPFWGRILNLLVPAAREEQKRQVIDLYANRRIRRKTGARKLVTRLREQTHELEKGSGQFLEDVFAPK